MAVWGRAIAVLALLGVLTACEYAEEGEPRPTALRSSSPTAQPNPLPAPTTPDPAWLAKMDQNTERVNALLGPADDSVMGMVGGVGDGRSAGVARGTNDSIPAGDYVFRIACVGGNNIHFERFRNGDTPEKLTIPCGEVTEIRRTLPGGNLTVELAGPVKGTEVVGGVLVIKAPPKR